LLAKGPVEFEGYFPPLYLDIGLDGIILYDPDKPLRCRKVGGVTADSILVQMVGITKRFPGVLANDHIDFDVKAGEVHALLG
jgi:hypothetical protein